MASLAANTRPFISSKNLTSMIMAAQGLMSMVRHDRPPSSDRGRKAGPPTRPAPWTRMRWSSTPASTNATRWTSIAQMPLTGGPGSPATGRQVRPRSRVSYSGCVSVTPGKQSVPMLPAKPWLAVSMPMARK
ncbi:MAG TPA: hypothetical protein VK325_03385 [Pseudoxanthomonas sp.]|nr:hypothetical protein [Pseudoxanthomonas sp.]